MRLAVHHSNPPCDSFRAARVRSLYNIEAAHSFSHVAELPIDGMDWQIGVIAGPSGSGKTSLGRAIFAPGADWCEAGWPSDVPLVEALAPAASFEAVTGALAAVGLGAVPTWLRPHAALSTGEKFRAGLARLLLASPATAVVDEFSSVVDRQVARAASVAFGKAWRRTGGKVVLLTCHTDVLPWLQPDWVWDTGRAAFSARRRRRPGTAVDIHRVNSAFWPGFEAHHYLKLPKPIAAFYYVGFVAGEPVAHVAISTRPGMREARACRFVVKPDWQGMGIGIAFLNAICGLWLAGDNPYSKPMPTLMNTSHPGLAAMLRRHPSWQQISASLCGAVARRVKLADGESTGKHAGHFRALAGFRYLRESP